MKKEAKKSQKVWVCPWCDTYNTPLSFKDAVSRRKFTIAFTGFVWLLIVVIGFVETHRVNCNKTWITEIMCGFNYWQDNFLQNPWIFLRNLFIFPYLHNALDHILFIMIWVLIVLQSFEVRHGTKKTIFYFVVSNVIMGIYFGCFYELGHYLWPDSEFFSSFYDRSWMGASVAMFFILGVQVHDSKTPWKFLIIPIAWEIVAGTIAGVSPHINVMHESSILLGWCTKLVINRLSLKMSKG